MKKIKEIKWKVVLWGLLLLQFLYMLYWGTQKSGYYVDEFFTYDNAHYISASTPEREKLYQADYMEYGKWFDVEELKSKLTVKKEESLLQDSFQYNISTFLNQKPYMAILNYVEAIFFPGQLNWWSSLSINLVCFILNQIMLYYIVTRIGHDPKTAFMAMALYGFSGMAISMFVYVRMYMWLTFLVSTFTYLHILMWKEQCWWKNVLYELAAMFLLLIMFNNSPLPVLYGGAMIFCFSIGLIIKKEWKQVGYYSVPIIIGGVLYATIKTDYIKIFKNPEMAYQSGTLDSPTGALIGQMLAITPSGCLSRIEELLHTISRYLYGHFYVALIYIVMCGIFIIFIIRKRVREKSESIIHNFSAIEIIVLSCTCLYLVSVVIFNLQPIRYYCFIVPEIAVCIAIIFDYMAKYVQKEKVMLLAVYIALIGEIFYTAKIPRIENLYLQDREGVKSIAEQKGIDSVVIDYKWDDKVMYECLAYTDETTKVMFVKYEDMNKVELHDNVLVWQRADETDKIVQDLQKKGYTRIDEIAQTHESRVYLCKK